MRASRERPCVLDAKTAPYSGVLFSYYFQIRSFKKDCETELRQTRRRPQSIMSSSQAPYQLASMLRHESSLTPLLVLSNSKPGALNLEGKRKERICSFRHAWRKRNAASFVRRGQGLQRSMAQFWPQDFKDFYLKVVSMCRQSGKPKKASQSFSPRKAKKKVQSVFSEDMRLGKNTSQPASVRASPASECAQRAAILLVDKGLWPLSTV